MADQTKAPETTEAPKKKSKKPLIITILVVLLALAILITVGVKKHNKHKEDYFCQYAKPFSIDEVEGGNEVVLVAHRGLSSEAPENTIPAYELAAKKGFRFVECDIMTTKDKVWVVSHDYELNRMTDYKGDLKIADMTLREVQSYPVTEGANIKKYSKNGPVVTPTFEEWISCCKENNLYPVIELKTQTKDEPYQEMLDILKKYDMLKKATIISFEKPALEAVRKLDKTIPMQWLDEEMSQAAIDTAVKLGNCGLDIEYTSLAEHPDLCKKADEMGLALNAWTVDTAEAASSVVPLGLTYLTTNSAMPTKEEQSFVKGFLRSR